MNNLEITITILFATAIIILIIWVAKDKKYKWHENNVIPEPMPMNEYMSDDIVIRDLTTEKEIKGYFDHQRQHFVYYNGNMVSGAFIWRYI